MVTQPDQVLHVEGSVLIDAYNQGKSTLDGAYSDGETSITLTDASTFNEKGTGTINGVEFEWTAKSGNVLTVPDLNANYADDVTVTQDTGIFFREGYETDKQPSITIYDENDGGGTRDDISINAYSTIRMQLNDSAELKLTDDTLSLTPGNQDTGGFTFRGRSDLGMFESSYHTAIKAPENIYMMVDSNNNGSNDRSFIIQKNGSGVGNGTELFRVQEDGTVGIGTSTPSATLEVAGDAVFRRSEIIAISSNTNLSGISHAGRVLNCTSACTLSLQATPTEGEQYVIYNNSSGTITIAANGSDTINGSTNDMTITSQYKALTIIALSASAWIAIGA
jgi:hypothetical protein